MIKAKVKSDLSFAPFKVKIKANKHVRALLCVHILAYYINKSKFCFKDRILMTWNVNIFQNKKKWPFKFDKGHF